jgi:D-lactate dehydrogenase
VFTQDFNYPEEVKRYRSFMDDVCSIVVERYDGSLKGEHGTGRNMAPFVELEWGRKAYDLMKRTKKAFDPDNILNPGVMINDNPVVHMENLKPLPKTHEIVDKCIECGFCEVKCPSKNITTTPRQRIVVQREISRLRAAGKNGGLLQVLENSYTYMGEQTCATDGLCATACPVSIDTGRLTKYLRSLKHGLLDVRVAGWVADHHPLALSGVRHGLRAAGVLHTVLGSSLMERISSSRWNPHMPKGISAPRFRDIRNASDRTVVYFPSCIVRTMGPSKYDKDQRPVFEAMLSILRKAGYDVLFPEGMEKLCCGLPFESKGFFEQADGRSAELEKALLACGGGEYPVLCDTSPCLYRMRNSFTSGLKLYEPVEFIHTFLMDRLTFRKAPDTVAVHVTCSSAKMGLAGKFGAVAEACSEKVITPLAVGCCGFAGDRGFSHPELNESALAELRDSIPADCSAGYSNSRTCEIGLTRHSVIGYQSIVYLVDKCTI